ncbi:thermonuclease family protein [Shinella sp.]|uniref:thermonuclease family protein n=1 Tax=Shinella sp. TaxID=1870904 RepID=UPI002897A9ED|nr:thermonuclease family protein [Shinella sp.]
MTKLLCVLPVIVVCFTTACAQAGDIVGRASVIDGDTIEIAGERIRLNGIDAPESRQLCEDGAFSAYRCGQRAALALADWLDQAQPIKCKQIDKDRYSRIVATCERAGADVGEWLVRAGHALDWPRYSNGRYAAAQADARAHSRGIWRGRFDLPWEWRKENRRTDLPGALLEY